MRKKIEIKPKDRGAQRNAPRSLWKYTISDQVYLEEDAIRGDYSIGMDIEIIAIPPHERTLCVHLSISDTPSFYIPYRDSPLPYHDQKSLKELGEKYLEERACSMKDGTPRLIWMMNDLIEKATEEMDKLIQFFPGDPLPGWRDDGSTPSRFKNLSSNLRATIDVISDDVEGMHYKASIWNIESLRDVCSLSVWPETDEDFLEFVNEDFANPLDPLDYVIRQLHEQGRQVHLELSHALCTLPWS